MNTLSYRTKVNRLLADRDHALRSVTEEKERLEQAKQQLITSEQVQAILQDVAQAVQRQALGQIAKVVTSCLQSIWGDDAYEFRINFEQRRGKTEADLIFVRDGHELEPTDSSGGGVIDVASFALRLSKIMLTTPKMRRLIVADEPMRFLSPDRQPLIPDMLMKLAEDLGFQFIIASNLKPLRCGTVVELE